MSSTRNPLSCIFFYEKKVYKYDQTTRKSSPVLNADGTHRSNGNYINFLQVISCYWEIISEEGGRTKSQLNIFLNGGSVSTDPETGDRTMKPGYTVVLPQFLGEKFIDQMYNWSCAFGLTAQVPVRSTGPSERRNNQPSESRNSRSIREDDFVDPDQQDAPAIFEN